MQFDNKTLIITIVGLATIFALAVHETNLASVGIGGLVGYLSKDIKNVTDEHIIQIIRDEIAKYKSCNELKEQS